MRTVGYSYEQEDRDMETALEPCLDGPGEEEWRQKMVISVLSPVI